MKIVSGIFKGRNLISVEGATSRPTSSFTREMIFSTIYAYRENFTNVLDLYAGSGSLGCEALSRGASHVTFVDSSKKAISAIIGNICSLQVNDKSKVVIKKADTYLKSISTKDENSPFDLVFLDPPYDKNLINPTLSLLSKNNICIPDALIVVEHSINETLDESFLDMVYKTKRVGQTMVTVIRFKV